jgi:hypothetical protein
MASTDRDHLQHEIEYILDDDSVGEVRVTYLKDGHSEIKQARVLLSEDIMRLVDGYVKALKQELKQSLEAHKSDKKCWNCGYDLYVFEDRLQCFAKGCGCYE